MNKLAVILGLLMIVLPPARGQTKNGRWAKVEASLKEQISKEMPEWTCRFFEPVPEGDVIIYHCELGDILLEIAVIEYQNDERAEALFKETKAELKRQEEIATKNQGKEVKLVKEDLSNLGDEGYVFVVRGSEAVAFRKARFLVNISVPRPDDNKDVFFSRKFAQHAANALEDR